MKLPSPLPHLTVRRPPSSVSRRLFGRCLLVLLVTCPVTARAEESAEHEEKVRKTTAVALNYCRAALHRIRRSPQKAVFYEEQTRILNNLDLNQIEDPEVIALYKSILDEISQVEISERERTVIAEQFRRNVHRQLGTNFFVIGAQVATGQLGSAIQSGASSWWDYRNQEFRRDADQWKVAKSEFSSLMSRSSTFLDSFWRLSQKNNIPDRWLIRDQDLDQLARVLQEPDGERRLRMLKRMERFMECYPPYWYYKARVQQQLGHTEDALATYQQLTDIGSGHFRQDDMLASSTANMALLQEHMGHPDAARTAARVLDYSTRNWESNLICAWVLGRHQQYADAEDLILCNLDEKQEPQQSRIALVSLYYHSNDASKLASLLDDEQVVRDVPIPGLLLSAQLLGSRRMPKVAQNYLAATMTASLRQTPRGDALVLAASPGWKLNDARPEVVRGSRTFQVVGFRPGQQGMNAEFLDSGSPADSSSETGTVRVVLNYPSTPPIHVTLNEQPVPTAAPQPSGLLGSRTLRSGFPSLATRPQPPASRFRIAEIELPGLRLSFRDVIRNDSRSDDSDVDVSTSGEPRIRS